MSLVGVWSSSHIVDCIVGAEIVESSSHMKVVLFRRGEDLGVCIKLGILELYYCVVERQGSSSKMN